MVTKTVNNELLKHVTSLGRGLHSQEQYRRRECLEVISIPSSIDDKNLQSTVCSILGDIDVVCQSNYIEHFHRIKGDRTIIKFSSRRKPSEVLNKKEKLKNLDIGKYGLNDRSRMKASAPTSVDYRVNVKGFGKTRLQLPFVRLMALKNVSMINQLL